MTSHVQNGLKSGKMITKVALYTKIKRKENEQHQFRPGSTLRLFVVLDKIHTVCKLTKRSWQLIISSPIAIS